MNDLLEFGVGVDLSLDEETYYFVGTCLFEMAKGLGIKSNNR